MLSVSGINVRLTHLLFLLACEDWEFIVYVDPWIW